MVGAFNSSYWIRLDRRILLPALSRLSLLSILLIGFRKQIGDKRVIQIYGLSILLIGF